MRYLWSGTMLLLVGLLGVADVQAQPVSMSEPMASDNSLWPKWLHLTSPSFVKPVMPACTACASDRQSAINYEQATGCLFPGLAREAGCRAVKGLDLFRWAISKQETGGLGFSPGHNPCNAANKYCAAQTGNPASAGTPDYYAASYGRTQITLTLLVDWLVNGRFKTVPSCLQDIANSPAKLQALKDALVRQAFVRQILTYGPHEIAPATVDAKGKIQYPTYDKVYQQHGIDEALFQRMSAWQAVRKMIEEAHKKYPNQGDGQKILNVLNPEPIPHSHGNLKFGVLLEALGMTFDRENYTGINRYIRYGVQFEGALPPIWNEAINDFQSAAVLRDQALYNDLMYFYGSQNCYRQATNQMFELNRYGYNGKNVDPKQAYSWVTQAAGRWNGSGAGSKYAENVYKNYQDYFKQYYGKSFVCGSE